MPILMVQPTLFWLLSGIQGVVMAVILVGITWMMITSARNSMNAFVESIRIRFEKDGLLAQLSAEKQATSRALEAAEQANRAKSFFLAAASHDLRQPLYAATLLGDTLSLHPLGTEPAALVEKQREALKVATALFDNILDLSKFEAGAVRPVLRPIRMAAFLEELGSEFRPAAEAKGLSLEMDTRDATIESDYDLLARLVRNLLSNAVRYTESGCIRLRAIEHADAVSIVVEDTGIGIPKVQQDQVFKEFQQLDNPQRSRDKGVGLGLAIVRHIAQLLGHPVTLASDVGKGTRIEVRVQRVKSARLTDHSAEDATPAGREPAAASSTSLSGLRVWIVEDDPLVRDALQQYLALLGCVHRFALDRAELERLIEAEGSPDFVILDDMLGTGETGLELAGWLAQRVPPSHLLVATGNVSPERWAELNASGFHVLRKPLSAAAINEWMRRGRGDPAAAGADSAG
jgi:signal transduction histidine kinase